MTTNWPRISAIIGAFILLWAVFSSALVQNLIFNKNSEDVNSYLTLQKTKGVYFSDIVNNKYLNIINYQPDTIKEFNSPDNMIYGEQASFVLRIDGNDELRKIKVFVTDPNNVIRFADDRTASYINANSNNESLFETQSQQISVRKKIIINLDIPQSNYEVINGVWKFNIIVLKENGETSLFLSKSIDIGAKENLSTYLVVFIVIFLTLGSILIFLFGSAIIRK